MESPFKSKAELFDNREMFPDMVLVVSGLERPLLLHRGIMASASKLIKGLLNSKQTGLNTEPNKIEWMFDTADATDRTALLKVLRFCYDETMRVELNKGELCPVITALFRLQVTCFDQILKRLTDFAVEQAKADPKIGTVLLMETQSYPECRSANIIELDKILARALFTAKNMRENRKTVVDDCLMKLPAEYLDMAEYGDPHADTSEFRTRIQYLKENGERMDNEEKENVIQKCDLSKLQGNELGELRSLGFVGQEMMIELYSKALERSEKESKRRSERAEKECLCFISQQIMKNKTLQSVYFL